MTHKTLLLVVATATTAVEQAQKFKLLRVTGLALEEH